LYLLSNPTLKKQRGYKRAVLLILTLWAVGEVLVLLGNAINKTKGALGPLSHFIQTFGDK
jgi:hypothetical protein